MHLLDNLNKKLYKVSQTGVSDYKITEQQQQQILYKLKELGLPVVCVKFGKRSWLFLEKVHDVWDISSITEADKLLDEYIVY